jgi:hypothetical protein
MRWAHLAIFSVVVLGIPAALRWGDLVKVPFDTSPVRRLESSRPECVLVGDSMLRSRIDGERLNEIADCRCESLAYPGTGSAVWYLITKNIVGVLARPPRYVIILFRDRQLTLPGLRTEGRYRNGLEAFMPTRDPEFERVVKKANGEHAPFFERLPEVIYPLQKYRRECQESLQNKALKVAARGAEKSQIRERLAEIFDVKNLRHLRGSQDAMERDESARVDPDNQVFADVVEDSFLPMTLNVAERRNTQLVFYRVKSRPHRGVNVQPDRPALRQYIRDLGAYLHDHGAIFIDESPAEDITVDFYGEGDHVADPMMRRYTELFWQRLRPSLTLQTAPLVTP